MNIRKASCAAAVAATLALATTAYADTVGYFFMTGNKLLRRCNEPLGSHDRALCMGFVVGVSDLEIGLKVRGGKFQSAATVPQGATIGQVTDVVVRYLTSHPELRHYPASDLVWSALTAAFPTPEG